MRKNFEKMDYGRYLTTFIWMFIRIKIFSLLLDRKKDIDNFYLSFQERKHRPLSRKNRTSQSVFHCKKCGHKENADINAARNILEYEKWLLEQKARWDTRYTESS